MYALIEFYNKDKPYFENDCLKSQRSIHKRGLLRGGGWGTLLKADERR